MANKRMFSAKIVDSDAFLDMPQTSQLLYFHLAMRTDDDGFVGNPKKIMRMIGSADNDIAVLLSKKFIIGFDNGIIVIKHHRINNNWDSHNCKRTQYLEEFSMLNIKENGAYTLDKQDGLPVQTEIRLKSDGIKSLEENRIEENRIDKNTSETSSPKKKTFNNLGSEIIKAFEELNPATTKMYNSPPQRKACDNLIETYGLEKVISVITSTLPKTNTMEYFPTITTPSQLWNDWAKLESKIMQYKSKITNTKTKGRGFA